MGRTRGVDTPLVPHFGFPEGASFKPSSDHDAEGLLHAGEIASAIAFIASDEAPTPPGRSSRSTVA